jgi:predicted PurR-regulated permease PerM
MRDDEKGLLSFVLTLAAFVLVVTILRVGREVMEPIALASVLAFLLAPLVAQLTRRGLGRTPAVILTAGLAFAIIAGVGWVMLSQAWTLLRELPRYEQNIDAKISNLKVLHEPALARLGEMAAKFEKELFAPAVGLENEAGSAVPVEVQPLRMTTLGAMGQIAGPVLRPLATAGIVVIFVIAILLQRESLRERIFRTVDATWLDVVARAYHDATQRVARYLRMQLVVNACFGGFVALGLYAIGIPGVPLWGLCAMLLRFIPFLGPWLAAAGPLVLALAIDPGWSTAVATLGLYVVAELVTANVVEVWLYGASTGISGFALLVAAVFWTWLWGAAGLFLSTPLTVCLMVTGRYVPGLNFLSVLLGRGAAPLKPSS